MNHNNIPSLLLEILTPFCNNPKILAIALAGSQGADETDTHSDFDVYVYSDVEPDVEWRREVITAVASRAEVGNRTWEPGDECILDSGKGTVDIMYRTPSWILENLARVLERHKASTGYSTCFWFNVLHSTPLWDPTGCYAALQKKAQGPYPPELKCAIITKNHPILRSTISSYLHQIEVALIRGDLVCIQHRTAAFLASYFDIVFAWNEVPHPGEKRMVSHALKRCRHLPQNFEQSVGRVTQTTVSQEHGPTLVAALHALADGLDALLAQY